MKSTEGNPAMTLKTVDRPKLVGCILAGGLSRRMGGGDKCLINIQNKPILEYVIKRLSPQVDEIVINANGDANRFSPFKLPVISDPIDGFAGPLAGILAGLLWTKKNAPEVKYMLSVAGDTPFFPLNLANDLAMNQSATKSEIKLASSHGKLHPVFGLWPVQLASNLKRWLTSGQEKKVLAWVNCHPNHAVEFGGIQVGDELIDPFFNINTPADKAIATELINEIDLEES